jgi:hypothetical protein
MIRDVTELAQTNFAYFINFSFSLTSRLLCTYKLCDHLKLEAVHISLQQQVVVNDAVRVEHRMKNDHFFSKMLDHLIFIKIKKPGQEVGHLSVGATDISYPRSPSSDQV